MMDEEARCMEAAWAWRRSAGRSAEAMTAVVKLVEEQTDVRGVQVECRQGCALLLPAIMPEAHPNSLPRDWLLNARTTFGRNYAE